MGTEMRPEVILFFLTLDEEQVQTLANGKEQINQRWSLSLFSPMSQQPYSMLLVACLHEDRAASSPGMTWHAVLVWFNASAGDANLFCLWLSLAAGCLSLFFEQIKLDGFHNGVSATRLPENTEKLHNMWHTTCPREPRHHHAKAQWRNRANRRKATARFHKGSFSDAARDLGPVSLMASRFR